MTGRLAGKTAIITGATTGIGLESARRFLAEGARVFITGSNQGRVEAALAELGDGSSGVAADVRDLGALREAATKARAFLGGIDILFANAGMGVFAPLNQVDEAGYDQQFDINVKGVFFTVQAVVPYLNPGASIILTASAVHSKGVATGSLYFASKAAVRSFARTMGAELAGNGTRVNTLSPGIVRTNFSQNTNVPEEAFEGFIGMVAEQAPLKRLGETTDMANAALFLASDESRYMTCADLLVDGGWMSV
ncbi:MAG: SDR family oxidoreductase [Pseudomonadota bacterium]